MSAVFRSSSAGFIDNYHSVPAKRKRRVSTVALDRADLKEGDRLSSAWIEYTFRKYECIKFIPEPNSDSSMHSQLALSRFTVSMAQPVRGEPRPRWTIKEHTRAATTDAYGTIEFQGGMHPHKAQYVRLAFDSDPADVFHLMEKVWGLKRPRLVITIHGGSGNFDMPDRLGQLFREGLLRTAETTGAWLITSGVDRGVVRHVAQALDEAGISARMRSRLVTIGIAAWGVLRRREQFAGRDTLVHYTRLGACRSPDGYTALNDRHTYFLLADNGTEGRPGADIFLRKRLEQFLARSCPAGACGTRRIPILCVALEGGVNTLNSVHQYLTGNPPIPTIICDGSGRVSNLLAYAYNHVDDRGNIPEECVENLVNGVQELVGDEKEIGELVMNKVVACAKLKNLLTMFRIHENEQVDADHTILKAILKGQNLNAAEQLSLTLAWNRVDIARAEVFREEQEWQMRHLHNALMDALVLNRVEFVKLLLEKGVNIHSFLSIRRLEQLYNADPTALTTLSHLVDGGSLRMSHVTVPDIADIIEALMGNAFRCSYSTRAFKQMYEKFNGRKHLSRIESLHMRLMSSKSYDNLQTKERSADEEHESEAHFQHPFNDLLLWAVLTRRHEMAKCMWLYGEQGMAKALVAIRLYKMMAKEVAHDYTEVEASKELRECAEDFKDCVLELLNHCHEQDDIKTMRLLTAVLPDWGHHTCLSLAVIANNKRFLAHPCCQVLLADLWHGGLRFRSQSNVKVALAVLFPPTVLLLDFKTPDQSASTRRRPSVTINELEDKHESKSSLVGISSFNQRFKSQCSSAMSKFELFYGAPITSFWIWTLSFSVFLLTFCYVLLIEFPAEIPPLEWALLAYVLGLGMEHFRKLLVLESSSFIEKFKVFYTRYWNILTTIAVVSFLWGFYYRAQPERVHSHARVILASNSVLWHMKLFDFLSVHPRIGPYITMAGKMVLAMSYIIIMLLVTLMAFGVARQSITFPHESWKWLLVRNIFYKPYFMLYGEVYAGEIDTCGDEGTNCVPGGWIPPVLMTIFLLVANILLINMLIAIFNNIFNVTNAMSQQVWMFQRYEQVLEYESTPIVPPPFTPIVHCVMAIKALKHKLSGHKHVYQTYNNTSDFSLKVYLDHDYLTVLYDFEEDCMDDLSRRKFHCALQREHFRSAAEVSARMSELSEENYGLRGKVDRLSRRIDQIVNQQSRLLGVLDRLLEEKPAAEFCRHDSFAQSQRSRARAELSAASASAQEAAALCRRAHRRTRTSVSLTEDLAQMAQVGLARPRSVLDASPAPPTASFSSSSLDSNPRGARFF